MRPVEIDEAYFIGWCERIFSGLVMGTSYPRVLQTTVSQGGFMIGATNTIFTNGCEDPWQWVTKRNSNSVLNDVAITTECNDCGHCVATKKPYTGQDAAITGTQSEVSAFVTAALQAT
jgi:hypothetical protein